MIRQFDHSITIVLIQGDYKVHEQSLTDSVLYKGVVDSNRTYDKYHSKLLLICLN